ELRLGAHVAPGAASGSAAPASHGILRAALGKADGILLVDAQADSEAGRFESVAATGVRSVVAAPIVLGSQGDRRELRGDNVLGAIYLENNAGPGRFDK